MKVARLNATRVHKAGTPLLFLSMSDRSSLRLSADSASGDEKSKATGAVAGGTGGEEGADSASEKARSQRKQCKLPCPCSASHRADAACTD